MILHAFLWLKPAASLAAALLLQASGGSGIIMFLPLIAIFGVFYVLLILPQQR